MHDPTVRWGLENVGMINWTELARQDTAEVIEKAKNFGILHGATMSIFDRESRSVGSFSRGDRYFTDTEIAFLKDAFQRLHLETSSIDAQDEDFPNALTRLSVELTHD